ncbi:MAG: TrkA family potassium uptake protein [Erysipelotrichaceae bacterium]|jgi:trk system potassium uptake protein TrkA
MSTRSFLIIGLGRFGRHVASKLNDMGMQVMAVDKEEKRVEEVLNYVTNAQVGDGTNQDFLSSLGVRNFDVCIVAIGDDFLAALETTSYLKELGAKKVVARASRDTQRKFLLRNGADDVVYPERDMGEWAAVRYAGDNIFDYMQLDGDFGVFEVGVPSAWVGRTIGEIGVRSHYKMNIVAVKTGKNMDVMTGADYTLEPGQTLMVLGRTKDITKYFNVR